MSDNKTKIKQISAGIALGATLWGHYTKAKEWWEERTRYTATVVEGSGAYNAVLEWLQRQTSPRSVKFDSTYDGIARYYNVGGAQDIHVEGYKIKVEMRSPSAKATGDDAQYPEDLTDIFNKKIVFTAHDPRAIDALERMLVDMLGERKKRPQKPNYFSIGEYGWEEINPARRPMESVFLAPGMKQGLLDDLDNFFQCEERFERMGLPWHRGYLLHGPPGNGKSSLANAIANKYNLNMFNLPLSSVRNDQKLQTYFTGLRPRSVVLLEDIDIFKRQISRDGAANGEAPTMAGLLNVLDGINTPHGLVTIMTTNRLEALDDALVRPGRVDYRMELLAPVRVQVEEMFEYIYNEPLAADPRTFESMAELTDIFKRNPFDAEKGRMEIKNA